MSDSKTPQLRVENISCILPESNKLGGLFVGNIYGAQNPAVLKQYGIRAVLTSSQEVPTYDPASIPFHLKINALDQEQYSILDDLQTCFQFIDKYRPLTNVLVHCYAGVSRSITIIVAYLIKKLKWDLNSALNFVKAKRIVAKPNDGFMKQLIKYNNDIKAETSRAIYEEPFSRLIREKPPIFQSKPQSYQHNNGYLYDYSRAPIQGPHHSNSMKKFQQYPSANMLAKNNSTTSKRQLSEQSRINYQTNGLSYNSHKKHSETPIPSILSKKNHGIKYHRSSMEPQRVNMNQYYYQMSHTSFNGNSSLKNMDKLQNAKTTSRLVRPKDLPGYKH